jgi:hypothetical protein
LVAEADMKDSYDIILDELARVIDEYDHSSGALSDYELYASELNGYEDTIIRMIMDSQNLI